LDLFLIVIFEIAVKGLVNKNLKDQIN